MDTAKKRREKGLITKRELKNQLCKLQWDQDSSMEDFLVMVLDGFIKRHKKHWYKITTVRQNGYSKLLIEMDGYSSYYFESETWKATETIKFRFILDHLKYLYG